MHNDISDMWGDGCVDDVVLLRLMRFFVISINIVHDNASKETIFKLLFSLFEYLNGVVWKQGN